jgi:hypothetical protein
MNRTERRAQEKDGIKIPPSRRLGGYRLVLHDRIEQQDDDGMVYARNLFRVVSEDGKTMCEETPDGPKPVLLVSHPQPVRRAVISTPSLFVRA